MKILIFTTHISIDDDSRFTHNKTGFGYMVYDIAKSIGRTEPVDLFCANIMTTGVCRDGVHILKWNWFKFLRYFSISNLYKACLYIRQYKVSKSTNLRIIYAYLLCGYIGKIIQKYDIVQIHGCSFYSQAVMEVCKQNNIPYLVTLHGLNSFNESIGLEPSMAKYEKDFLISAYKRKKQISFISTGDIRKVCDYLETSDIPTNFSLVSNGCDIKPKLPNYNVRGNYKIKESDFVFLFVGNISENKNQIAVARAFKLLPKEMQNTVKVVFCGGFYDNGCLLKFIEDNSLYDKLICCGAIPKNEIHNYYIAANATILTSLSEGFGLSIIEGFAYGIPNLCFNDLSAVEDMYSPQAMITVERGDENLASGMQNMISCKWDRDFIVKYASRFSLEKMAENYLSLFTKIINK